MELSLLSREVIAMSAAVGLSHNMFDGALYLGVCDKIVPGLVMAALSFGHLPAIFVPSGPMASGLPNKEKVRIRQLYAEGKQIVRRCWSGSRVLPRAGYLYVLRYGQHQPDGGGIYGHAAAGLVLYPAGCTAAQALTEAAARQVTRLTGNGNEWMPMGKMVDEKVIVNGIVALLATGGSTNHTMHLVAMARAAGILINWDDFSEISSVVPLMARLYPNGPADINHFQAAGVPVLMRELLKGGLLHEDVNTVAGFGLQRYTQEPWLNNGELDWREGATASLDAQVIATIDKPFSPHGGTKVLSGNLGRAVMKTSAVPEENQIIEAPAVVFESQHDVLPAFDAGLLDKDCVVVVRHQGPKANGMPELHKLMPPLGVLLDRRFKIALVTDGRLSGASGKVPSAIHVTPEAYDGGLLAKVRDGDMIRVNGQTGELTLLVDEAELAARQPHIPDLSASRVGTGREMFSALREKLSGAEQGATCITF
jgi:phosphogluconate dehydratase